LPRMLRSVRWIEKSAAEQNSLRLFDPGQYH